MIAYYSSLEPMGLVDGPGLRYVVFLQGCKLRCLYCHNPETWKLKAGKVITSEELLHKILRYKNYYKNGGVTFSGGEPLLQSEFLIDILKKCKENNLHTAIDTSGVGNGNYEEILKYVDLIILDIKAIDEEKYSYITKAKMNEFSKFLAIAQKMQKPFWLRTVIVPGFNDTKEDILNLSKFVKKIDNVKKVELLAYHLFGVDKYKELGIDYPLEGIKPMDEDNLLELQNYLNSLISNDDK